MRKWLSIVLILALALLPECALAAKSGFRIRLMQQGETLELSTASLSGEVQWRNSDPDAVALENGVLSAKAEGRSLVSASNGKRTLRCGFVVLPKSIELRPGERHTLARGGVEKYDVSDKRVISISKKGVISAKQAGSAKLRVRYGGQSLLIDVVVAAAEQVQQSKAAQLDCAGSATQIVLVEYEGGSRATLSIHEKQSGLWKQLYACTAYVGAYGIGKTREGDKKTPSGVYNLTTPFGIKADPGAKMNYTQATKYHYWCGTSGSEYYNRLIDTRTTNRARTSGDEYLINYGGYYNYGMFIDYNASGEAGKGSCIFLHCTGGKKSTAGCIAIPERAMKQIVCWAEPGAKIAIQEA